MATAQWALRRLARPAAAALAAGTATRRARSQAAAVLPLGTPAPRPAISLVRPAAAIARRWASTDAAAESTGSKAAVKREFQAETQKLLHIVANSLYSEKEVFVRELISNASDALEKLRHAQVVHESVVAPSTPLEIRITTNALADLLIIEDTGIGMTEEDLIRNLGTIAHSGSKQFMTSLKDAPSASARDNIIGQFGVGFYSAFMVADHITVYSRSALGDGGERGPGWKWSSDGSGSYEMEPVADLPRGTRIELKLKDAGKTFADKKVIEGIVQKYSNFVGFPILLNGDKLNTIQPLWTLPKEAVSEEQHKEWRPPLEFYRFISGAFDQPRAHLHYATDAPIHLRTLLYLPTRNAEKLSMQRSEPGVNLYARKVLIQARSKALVPDWLRFVKGVCDSEDIPLNLSREMLQDSALIAKLKNVLTGRVIKWLSEEANKDPDKYIEFFLEFGSYLKEGACTDATHKDKLAKLLLFPTSAPPPEDRKEETPYLVGLQKYVDRMKPGQKGIYYLLAPTRAAALASPYYEPFKLQDIEVLFLHDPVDEFVMNSLRSFEGKEFISIDAEDVDVGESAKADSALSDKEAAQLVTWLKDELASDVVDVKLSKRLVSHPAMVVGHDSPTMRNMLKMLDPTVAASVRPLPTTHTGTHEGPRMAQKLEVNPSHPVIVGLAKAREARPEVAKLVARQVLNTALIAAGVLDDPRSILPELNRLMEAALGANASSGATTA